jgi:hypothetical protein
LDGSEWILRIFFETFLFIPRLGRIGFLKQFLVSFFSKIGLGISTRAIKREHSGRKVAFSANHSNIQIDSAKYTNFVEN